MPSPPMLRRPQNKGVSLRIQADSGHVARCSVHAAWPSTCSSASQGSAPSSAVPGRLAGSSGLAAVAVLPQQCAASSTARAAAWKEGGKRWWLAGDQAGRWTASHKYLQQRGTVRTKHERLGVSQGIDAGAIGRSYPDPSPTPQQSPGQAAASTVLRTSLLPLPNYSLVTATQVQARVVLDGVEAGHQRGRPTWCSVAADSHIHVDSCAVASGQEWLQHKQAAGIAAITALQGITWICQCGTGACRSGKATSRCMHVVRGARSKP